MASEGFPKSYGPSAEGDAGLGAEPELTRRVLDDVMFGDPGSTPLREEDLLTEAGAAQQPPSDPPEAPAATDGDGAPRRILRIEREDGSFGELEILD